MSEKVKPEDIDLEAMKKDTKKLAQSNNDKLQAINGALDPILVAQLKMEVFIDTFLDESAKIVFAYNLQTRFQQIIEEDLKQIRQAQLTEGIPQLANKLNLRK